jgi:hypothetical protein
MKATIIARCGLLTLVAGNLVAQDTAPTVAVGAIPPLPFTLVILAAACACAVFCFQVFMVVRGGQLSRSWLIFGGGFAILALSQVAVLLSGFGVMSLNRFIVPGLLVVMTGMFFYGLYETKRVLS